MNLTGPLFSGPSGANGIHWLAVLPVLVAVPAMIILIIGVVRGKLPPGLATAGVVLPIAAYGLGCLFLMEDSKKVSFCTSCHVMVPILKSLESNDGSLAAIHYNRGLVRHDDACYTCHSGYGIWGTYSAKFHGMMHLVRTATSWYDLPLHLNGPFDIDSCLGCHAHAPTFQAVEAHQNIDIQKQLVTHEISCTGLCHPAAHPPSALNGTVPAS